MTTKVNKDNILETDIAVDKIFSDKNIYFIILAAGSGKRAKEKKQLSNIAGRTPIEIILEKLYQTNIKYNLHINPVLVISSDDFSFCNSIINQKEFSSLDTKIVFGGRERYESAFNALKSIENTAKNDDFVLLHDVARINVQIDDIINLLKALLNFEAASLSYPVSDTICTFTTDSNDNTITGYTDRTKHYALTTPQGFHYSVLYNAHLNSDYKDCTDDTSLVYKNTKVKLVESSRWNIKITYPEDFIIANKIIS